MIVHGTASKSAAASGDMNGSRRGTPNPRQASSSAKAGISTTKRTRNADAPTPSNSPSAGAPATIATIRTVTAHTTGSTMTRNQRRFCGMTVSVRISRVIAPPPSTRARTSATTSGPRASTHGATSVGIAGRNAMPASTRQRAMKTPTKISPRRGSGEASGSC